MSTNPNGVNGVPATENGLVRAHGFAALGMVFFSVLMGIVLSLKFHWPELMGRHAWLTWGRLRYAHTQGIFFGWLGNAFLMFCYHAVPRLAGRPVLSRRLGWVLFFVWNCLVVLSGWVLVLAGYSQPLEWAEFPLVVDAFVVVAFVLLAIQFVLPFFRTRLSELYVSAWYIMGAIVFTLFAYPVGNLVPELVPGARGATYSGLWIHDAVGLYATPFAVAIAYFVIPIATGRPIFSHFLSMLTFWMLFFIYPLNGTHHFLFSSIPMSAQFGAILASVYLGMDVTLNVANQLLSLRGASGIVARDEALRYTWLGVVLYLVVSLQGSVQALMPLNRFVHFSDWVIGHSHLAMIGFASFAAIGGMLHVWKRTPGVRYSARAAGWSFWLLALGLFFMVADLTIAGLVQGELWQSDLAWLESVRASRPYWMVRSASGVVILAGFVALGLSMLTGPVGQLASSAGESLSDETVFEESTASTGRGLHWLQNAYVFTGVAGFGFFLLSFVVLAVWPNQTLEQEIAETRPPHLPTPTASEQRGRAIYGREGCLNCHSQFVRSTVDDVRRFGSPTQAWETERDFPQLWGTRRIGPDLAREHGRRSRDWQLTHLWNPRFVVPESIMPSHPWLFSGSPGRPTQEALDLLAYLDSLGRDAIAAGAVRETNGGRRSRQEEERMGIFCDCGIPRTPGSPPLLDTRLDASEHSRYQRRGELVFERHCGGCHGNSGKGDGPAAASLLPAPRDLSTARFSDLALSRILWSGVGGSAMPDWHEMPLADLRGLAVFVQSLTPPERTDNPLTAAERQETSYLYSRNCANCHGESGSADGLTATVLPRRPTNFREIRPALDYAEQALAHGVPGSAMTPWESKLSPPERRLLARYVRTLYQER
jgi:cbb3-type cytochrome c oxidase subunit I